VRRTPFRPLRLQLLSSAKVNSFQDAGITSSSSAEVNSVQTTLTTSLSYSSSTSGEVNCIQTAETAVDYATKNIGVSVKPTPNTSSRRIRDKRNFGAFLLH